ncbi:MAG: hypothetical protein U0736_21445 [Gemmataceae bacterium]
MSADSPSPERPPADDRAMRYAYVIGGGILCGLAGFVLPIKVLFMSGGGPSPGDGMDGMAEGALCCGSFTGVIATFLGGWAIWRFTADRTDPPR